MDILGHVMLKGVLRLVLVGNMQISLNICKSLGKHAYLNIQWNLDNLNSKGPNSFV